MPPALVLRTKGVGVLLGEESTMRLLYSGLNGSGYDYDSQVHGFDSADVYVRSSHIWDSE